MINTSGIFPTGGHVLVKPDKVEEKTAGGIYIPATSRDKEQQAATIGTVVEIGKSAWADLDDGHAWAKINNRVSYAKYAGILMVGNDKEDYVLINDNDILAILDFK